MHKLRDVHKLRPNSTSLYSKLVVERRVMRRHCTSWRQYIHVITIQTRTGVNACQYFHTTNAGSVNRHSHGEATHHTIAAMRFGLSVCQLHAASCGAVHIYCGIHTAHTRSSLRPNPCSMPCPFLLPRLPSAHRIDAGRRDYCAAIP
jgi:hypothetical protein